MDHLRQAATWYQCHALNHAVLGSFWTWFTVREPDGTDDVHGGGSSPGKDQGWMTVPSSARLSYQGIVVTLHQQRGLYIGSNITGTGHTACNSMTGLASH